MRVEKKIKEELGFIYTLDTLVKAYQEIAVVKMQHVRSTVLTAREFLELLNVVFSDVKYSYAKEIEQIQLKKKKNSAAKKSRRVGVFLSANSRFYGDIIKKVHRKFMDDYQKTYDEMVIMGRVGKEMVERSGRPIPFKFIEYDDRNISKEMVLSFLENIKDFDVVQIYFGKFENVVNQEPAVTVVTGEETSPTEEQKRVDFFFEPSLTQILSYFENQVVAAFLLQSIHESDLAKLASRTKSMEQAHERIEDKRLKLFGAAQRARRIDDDRKQQERLAGMYLWKK